MSAIGGLYQFLILLFGLIGHFVSERLFITSLAKNMFIIRNNYSIEENNHKGSVNLDYKNSGISSKKSCIDENCTAFDFIRHNKNFIKSNFI